MRNSDLQNRVNYGTHIHSFMNVLSVTVAGTLNTFYGTAIVVGNVAMNMNVYFLIGKNVNRMAI